MNPMKPRALTPEEAAQLNTDSVVFGVDSDGKYLGLVARGTPANEAGGPPPFDLVNPRWDSVLKHWVSLMDLDTVKAMAHEKIDGFAGQARLRYVTSVPGQEGTYVIKAQQAKEFLAAVAAALPGDPMPTVPPYVQAEADANDTDVITAATTINAIAVQWSDVINPAIERERIKAKRLVTAVVAAGETDAQIKAATASVDALVSAAQTTLASI